jgi:uncharacterized membrane protein YvlD (DUF360 family)
MANALARWIRAALAPSPAAAGGGASAPPLPFKGGFVQTFGLDVRAALLAVLVDTLAFGGTIGSGGLLYAVEVMAGVVLAFITYRIQVKWYGDDHDSALIKALVIGLVTAIPVPITPILAGPAGLLGLAHAWLRPKR